MNILNLFVVIPVLTVAGILFTKDLKQSRMVSAIGMTAQLILSAILVVSLCIGTQCRQHGAHAVYVRFALVSGIEHPLCCRR